jgi:predicted Zn-dependent protease
MTQAIQAALAQRSNDAVLWEQLGEIKQGEGDYVGALAATQYSLDQLPDGAGCWQLQGRLLAQEGKSL